MQRTRVVVSGRVQGVFFRDSCRREALRRGVSGWVSNEPDATVAAEFEGSPEDVAAMVEWCRTGPPHARVERVAHDDVEPTGQSGFEVR